MFILMLLAFVGASIADLGAEHADYIHRKGPAAQETRAEPAKIRAIDASAGTLRSLAQAGVCAMLTFLGTVRARGKASGRLWVNHGSLRISTSSTKPGAMACKWHAGRRMLIGVIDG